MDPNWLWLIPVLGFVVFEAWGLWLARDRMQPLTFWARRLFGLGEPRSYLRPGWWIVGSLLLWLVFHFLVDGTLVH